MATKRTALVIDDEVIAQSTMTSMFWRLGWAPPTLIDNGEDALALLRKKQLRFDVIILDQKLPVMKGLEVLAKARALRIKLPPVIMITGEYDDTVEPRARELGAAFLMRHDLSEKKLKKMLSELLDD
jgi:CheY-like chemotaxis protein